MVLISNMFWIGSDYAFKCSSNRNLEVILSRQRELPSFGQIFHCQINLPQGRGE